MGVSLRETIGSALPELRVEPTGKRIRAAVAGRTVVDSVHALLIWEPRRIVPSWAVPMADVHAEIAPSVDRDEVGSASVGYNLPEVSARPVLDPSFPFTVHTSEGSSVDLTVAGVTMKRAGFGSADAALADYLVLDFAAFDQWWEEDAPALAHPRDPFHRIDALPSSRTVRIELDGELIAESTRPVLLFETMLPTRYYLPADDIGVALEPTEKQSACAYKGEAGYFRAKVGGRDVEDIAWIYREPLLDATPVKDLICFFNERVDVTVDGVPEARPRTPWS